MSFQCIGARHGLDRRRARKCRLTEQHNRPAGGTSIFRLTKFSPLRSRRREHFTGLASSYVDASILSDGLTESPAFVNLQSDSTCIDRRTVRFPLQERPVTILPNERKAIL